MNRLTHHLRLLVVALAAVCAVALNHRQVAVVRVLPAADHEATVGAGKHLVVVRERVSLESTHADVCAVAGPGLAFLPLDPLGEWLATQRRAVFARALNTALLRALVWPGATVFAGLLGASLAPQAP